MSNAQPKLVIGLTGGIGSGKSEVTARFHNLGVAIIDADVIAHEVVAVGMPALKSISTHFGEKLLLSDGNLDRKQLRDIIFNNNEEKKWLEALLHPLINQTLQLQLISSASPYTILSSPLLLETEQLKLVDSVLVVDCEPEFQISRASQRDHVSEDSIKAIMASQICREERLRKANDIILNNDNFSFLDEQVKKLHTQYISLAEIY